MTRHAQKRCQVEGCDSPVLARGWCNKHYLRWKAHGDPAFARPTVCTVGGCERPVTARGWCSAHYLRWRRTGTPEGGSIRQAEREHESTCSVEGCDRPYYGNGLCRRHYDRQRRAGDPQAPDRRLAFDPFSSDFWEHLDRSDGPDGCWPWLGLRNRKGYGTLARGGNRTRRQMLAHRLAYVLTHGEIPEGMYVCHRCDNPPCCNPAHLFLGTHVDNMVDMKQKGRARGGNVYGEDSNTAKLTTEQVVEIRRRAVSESHAALGREFGVVQSTISRIASGERRKYG